MSKQAQYEHQLVIDRCIVALHDYGTREGATASGVMSQLKADGFTHTEIEQAIRKFSGEES